MYPDEATDVSLRVLRSVPADRRSLAAARL